MKDYRKVTKDGQRGRLRFKQDSRCGCGVSEGGPITVGIQGGSSCGVSAAVEPQPTEDKGLVLDQSCL